MECKHCEELLSGYACGDLSCEEVEGIELHLIGCPNCRAALDSCRAAISLIADEPMLCPSRSESARLARGLDRIQTCDPQQARIRPNEVLGLAVATALTFAFLVIVLGLQLLGKINIMWVLGPINMPKVAMYGVAILVVTSLIPILVTARRRPLNGLTFSR